LVIETRRRFGVPAQPMTATPASRRSELANRTQYNGDGSRLAKASGRAHGSRLGRCSQLATLRGWKDRQGKERCVYNYGTSRWNGCAAGQAGESQGKDYGSKKGRKMRFEATRLLKTKEVDLERTQIRSHRWAVFRAKMGRTGPFGAPYFNYTCNRNVRVC
jgi:hypothetical protein